MRHKTTCIQEVPMNIEFAPNVFEGGWLISEGSSNRRIVFVDSFFYSQGDWKNKISACFDEIGCDATVVPVDCPEGKKDMVNLMFILSQIENFNLLRRNEPIIAIGGGVLMDMVGFAASIFRRGVPYIKVPTTLLGMVDAGLGAKTSINHFGRRNRLGSYFPPVLTIVDKQFLSTLDKQEIIYAMGEIVKIATIKDEQLFYSLVGSLEKCLDANFNCLEADYIIRASIDGMMAELVPNLWEKDLKRVVDFGHTFSPIPEMKSLEDHNVPSLSHGEAVALDVVFSSRLSMMRGMLSEVEYERVVSITRRSGLRTEHPYFNDPYLLWDSLLDATRHRNGSQNTPVPTCIGEATFLQDITLEEIKEVVNEGSN